MKLKAMSIIPATTGLPEDRFVNTFHFDTDASGLTVTQQKQACANVIVDFFNDTHLVGGSNRSLANFMSHTCDRGADKAEVRVYDMAEPEPREPFKVPFTLGPIIAGQAVSLPDEVAICLSYYATRNVPRQRGRVFVGPLNASVIEHVGGRPRVWSQVRDLLALKAQQIITDLGPDLKWCVRGKAPLVGAHQYYPITAGWIDDAFDTQRRRGVKASTRTLWT